MMGQSVNFHCSLFHQRVQSAHFSHFGTLKPQLHHAVSVCEVVVYVCEVLWQPPDTNLTNGGKSHLLKDETFCQKTLHWFFKELKRADKEKTHENTITAQWCQIRVSNLNLQCQPKLDLGLYLTDRFIRIALCWYIVIWLTVFPYNKKYQILVMRG